MTAVAYMAKPGRLCYDPAEARVVQAIEKPVTSCRLVLLYERCPSILADGRLCAYAVSPVDQDSSSQAQSAKTRNNVPSTQLPDVLLGKRMNIDIMLACGLYSPFGKVWCSCKMPPSAMCSWRVRATLGKKRHGHRQPLPPSPLLRAH